MRFILTTSEGGGGGVPQSAFFQSPPIWLTHMMPKMDGRTGGSEHLRSGFPTKMGLKASLQRNIYKPWTLGRRGMVETQVILLLYKIVIFEGDGVEFQVFWVSIVIHKGDGVEFQVFRVNIIVSKGDGVEFQVFEVSIVIYKGDGVKLRVYGVSAEKAEWKTPC
jgi:hypothetical protein